MRYFAAVAQPPKELENPSYRRFPEPDSRRKVDGPVLILGAARSGTTAIGGAVAKLGFPYEGGPPVYEAGQLIKPLQGREVEKMQQEIAAITAKHGALWAIKMTVQRGGPSVMPFPQFLHEVISPAALVIVTRDPALTANRRGLMERQGRDLAEYMTHLNRSILDFQNSVVYASQVDCPVMFISYDRVLSDAEAILNELCEFLDWQPSETAMQDAVDFIQPMPTDYLRAARKFLVVGQLEKATEQMVRGWAHYAYLPDTLELEILVNGEVVGKVTADEDRPARARVKCGFQFKLNGLAKIGDEVRVRAVGDEYDLKGSPATVS